MNVLGGVPSQTENQAKKGG